MSIEKKVIAFRIQPITDWNPREATNAGLCINWRNSALRSQRFCVQQPHSFRDLQVDSFLRVANKTRKVDEKPRIRGVLLVCVAERGRTCVALTGKTRPGRCGTPSPARYSSPYGLTITGRLSSYASRGECSIARWSHLLEVGPNLLLVRSP